MPFSSLFFPYIYPFLQLFYYLSDFFSRDVSVLRRLFDLPLIMQGFLIVYSGRVSWASVEMNCALCE